MHSKAGATFTFRIYAYYQQAWGFEKVLFITGFVSARAAKRLR
jgi:hypothetical protein